MRMITQKNPDTPDGIRHVVRANGWSFPAGLTYRALCGYVVTADEYTFKGWPKPGSFVCYACYAARHARLYGGLQPDFPFYHPKAVMPCGTPAFFATFSIT